MKSMMEFDSPRRCGVQVIAFISVMLLFASTTAVALEREPTKRRIAPYLARLKDTSRDVRLEAAQALGEIEWPDEPDKAVAALIDVLKNDLAGTVRAAAAQALANFFWGEARISAVQALIDSLKDTDADVCATAVETLCRIKDMRALEPVLSILKHSSAKVRSKAAYGITLLSRDRSLKAPLVAALRDEDVSVRVAAASSLKHYLPDHAIYEALVDCLLKDKPRVRIRVGWVLLPYARQDKRIVQGFLDMLQAESRETRSKGIHFLGETGTKLAVMPLIRLLARETDSRERRGIAFSLGKIADPRAVDALISVLSTTKGTEDSLLETMARQAAAQALGEIGDKRALPSLLEVIKKGPSLVQHSATFALLKLDPELCVEPCKRLFLAKDTRWDHRHHYANLLGLSKNPRAFKVLVGALSSKDRRQRRFAAEALGHFGNKAVDVLIKAAGDRSVGVVAAAIKSLGKSDDPRAMHVILKAFRNDNRSFVWQAARSVLRAKNHPEAENRTSSSTEER